jgi:hypothetical protein
VIKKPGRPIPTFDELVKSPTPSLRGATRRGNLSAIQGVMSQLRFARNDISAFFGLFTNLSTFDFAQFFEPRQGLVNLFPGEDLFATGALVEFFGESFIDEFIGEIDRVKAHGEMVNLGKILIPAVVA